MSKKTTQTKERITNEFSVNGKELRIRWNEKVHERTDINDEKETFYEYNEAVCTVFDTRDVLIEKIIGSLYTQAEETALINNQTVNHQEYNEYQYNRMIAKNLADKWKFTGTPDEWKKIEEQKYLEWLSCTRLQGRLKLIEMGLWSGLVDWVKDNATDEQKAFFEDAKTWRFNDPVFQQIGTSVLSLKKDEMVAMMEGARLL